MSIYQANTEMALAVGICSTKEIWRTNGVAASNNGSTGPVLELRQNGVAKRRYQLTQMQAVAGGIRCENTVAWLAGEDACVFNVNDWTVAIVQGAREWVKQYELGDVDGNALDAVEKGLVIGAGFLIGDPESLAGGITPPPSGQGLTTADVTLLGRFKLPETVGATGTGYMAGGVGLKNGRTSGPPQFYCALGQRRSGAAGFIVAGALFEAPTTFASPTANLISAFPAASVIESTTDLLDGPITRMFKINGEAILFSNGGYIAGIAHDPTNNTLSIAGNSYYSEEPVSNHAGGFFKRSATLSAIGTTVGPVKLSGFHPRGAQGGMQYLPPTLQVRFQCSAITTGGAVGVSVNADISQGPSFITFNPADVTTPDTTITSISRAHYPWASAGPDRTFAAAMGSGIGSVTLRTHPNFSEWYDWPSHYRGGVIFIPNRQVAVAIGVRGTTRAFYKSDDQWQTGGSTYEWTTPLPLPQNDPTNQSGNAPRGYPYERVMQVINFSEYDAVVAGTKQPWQVQGNNQFAMPSFPFALIGVNSAGSSITLPVGMENAVGCTPVGAFYDELTNRIYVVHGGVSAAGQDGRAFVDVFQLAAVQ